MKKVAFFPYHDDLQMLTSFKEHLKDLEIVGFLSYKEDKPLIDRLNMQYQIAEKTSDEVLDVCDALIVLDNQRNFRSEKYYQMIEAAITAGKEVWITPYAASQLQLKKYKGQYNLLQRSPMNGFAPYEFCKDRFCDIHIPAIAVMGQGKSCGKFECQAFLQTVLCKNYKTAVLSSNALGAMFGFYTLPEFLFEAIPFEEKIVRLNYYIRAIIQQEKPDVMLLGIPEGIVPAEKREFNHFGEYALVITSAVTVDLSVLSMYYLSGEIDNAGLESVAAFCREKFRIPYISMFMSNIYFDKPQNDNDPFIYEYLDNAYFMKHHPDFRKLETSIFSMKDRRRAKDIVFRMIQPLTNNINAI